MAQEAFSRSVKQMSHLDISDVMEKADQAIEHAISMGALCVNVGPFTDILKTEKAALKLQDLGYKATTIAGQAVIQDGIPVASSGIHINWKYMPDNTRENYD